MNGSALVEALLVLGLLCAVYFPCHREVLRRWRGKLEALQEKRWTYDGQRGNFTLGGSEKLYSGEWLPSEHLRD